MAALPTEPISQEATATDKPILRDQLTNKKRLIKNVGINLFTRGLPIVLGLVCVPFLIRGMGAERFGILTMVWAIVGYASIFDLGLGRALTQVVARKIGHDDLDDMPALIWTGATLSFALGALGAVGLGFAAPMIVSYMKVSPHIYNEVVWSVWLLALSVPGLVCNIGLNGVLEAYQQFKAINLLRMPIIISNFLLPLIILKFSPTLTAMVAAILVGRYLTIGLTLVVIQRMLPNFMAAFAVKKDYFHELFKFGKWITVIGFVSPVMGYFDRFVLSNMLGAQQVAFYTTPYDTLLRAKTFVDGAISVIFPAMSTVYVESRQKAKHLYWRGLLAMAALSLIPFGLVYLLAEPGLALWLKDAELARKCTPSAQWLAIAFYAQVVASVPYSFVQAAGRADLTAKFLFLELPFYIATLLWGINQFGLIGAPIAMLLRTMMDGILLHTASLKLCQEPEESPIAHSSENINVPEKVSRTFQPVGRRPKRWAPQTNGANLIAMGVLIGGLLLAFGVVVVTSPNKFKLFAEGHRGHAWKFWLKGTARNQTQMPITVEDFATSATILQPGESSTITRTVDVDLIHIPPNYQVKLGNETLAQTTRYVRLCDLAGVTITQDNNTTNTLVIQPSNPVFSVILTAARCFKAGNDPKALFRVGHYTPKATAEARR